MLLTALFSVSAVAGPFSGDWLPDARTCIMSADAFEDAVKADRKECKAMAKQTDDRGYAFETCMSDEGWLPAPNRVDADAVTGSCHDDTVRIARQVAVEGLRPITTPLDTTGTVALR